MRWSTAGVNPLGRPRGRGCLARLKDELELGEEEIGKISAALEAEFAAIRSAGPPGAAAIAQEDMREQVRCASPRCCAPCCRRRNTSNTRRWRGKGRAGPRRATIWTYEDGALWPHEVGSA